MKRSRPTSARDEPSSKRASSSASTDKNKKPRTDAPLAPHLAARPQPLEAFPRGGGTGLTPVEYRQSVLEGRRESAAAAADDLFQEGGASKRSKLVGKQRKKTKKEERKRDVPKDRVRVELLNYKRLMPGTKILCNVLAVHPLAVVVSMCDQLLGHVPVTSVSQTLTERLQRALDDEDEEESDEEKAAPPELHELFHVGQWVRASVESVNAPGAKRQWGMGREGGEYERESQRVQLTLEPRVVNEGIRLEDLSAGYLLSATIQSEEDHGYTLDLGLQDDVHGFLPFKATGDAPLPVGAVVLLTVDSVEGRVVRCAYATKPTTKPVATPPSQTAVLPGLPVKALITARVPQGLSVKLFGMLDGTIDTFHIPTQLEEEQLQPGQKIDARVLWNMPGDWDQAQDDALDTVGARRIGLSAAPHVVSLTSPLVEHKALPDAYPIGTRLRVRVATVFTEWGLLCRVVDAPISAFVHIARVSDDHIEALAPTSGAYQVGSEHEARVIGHAMTDRLLLLSLQTSVLEKQFMRVSEVPVGDVVRVTIRKVTPQAIFVRLSGNVDGVVFPMHYSDVRLAHPEKKFKPNLELKARIIHTDPMRNRIVLTFKRTLVQSDLPLVSSIEQARVGVITTAVVLRQLQASILVELGGTLRAVVPFSEASDTSLTPGQLQELYPTGKVVKVRLTKVEPDTGRITASIRQTSAVYLEKLNVDAVQVGEEVQARVAAIKDDVAITTLEPSGTRALIALSYLAQQRSCSVRELHNELQEGDLLERLYVVSKNKAKGLVILSHEPPAKAAPVAPGAVHHGKVMERQEAQLTCTVALAGTNCRARLHVTECNDDLSKAVLPSLHDVIECVVLDVRKHGREAEVSTRLSRRDQEDAKDPVVDRADQLEEGMHVRGIVKSVTDHGVYVSLGRRVDARVMIKELFDEYVKDFRGRFHVGECVRGTVLRVEPSGKVELSLKKSRLSPTKSSKTSRWHDFHEGDKVNAYIRGTADYGVFVQVDGTDISGLCHKSELSDSQSADAVRAFAVGDRVKAVILKIDAEKKRISFGLKPSYFDEEDMSDDEEEGTDDEDDEEGNDDEEEDEVEQDLIDDEAEVDDDVEESEDEEDSEEDEEDMADFIDDGEDVDEDEDEEDDEDMADFIDDDDDDVNADEDDDDDDVNADENDDDDDDSHLPKQSLQEGFRWGASTEARDDDNDDDESDDEPMPKAKAKNKKTSSEDITAELDTKKLESATDYERLLLGSPNSSYLWIQFMTFYLQLGDVDKARQVARRAIKVINFREEQEKLNVWIALLNVENMYGSPDTLNGVFKEAILLNDAYEVHMRLIAIYEQSNKVDEAIDLFKRAAKKFGARVTLWIDWYQFYLRHDRAEEAHALVSRSLQSLDRVDHIRALTAYALAEFKLGDVEHARTMFETLVSRYPKRLDLWWQYMDQEARVENINGVRSLMERAMVARKHTTKQMKSLLQKWLVLEKRIGDDAGVQAVLDRARAFVARVQGQETSKDDEDDDDEDDDEEDDDDDDM